MVLVVEMAELVVGAAGAELDEKGMGGRGVADVEWCA